ncbi:UNVERIFIED_CONTAM: hypothetical protein Sradi_5308400, partial [Sesamum radiatum]
GDGRRLHGRRSRRRPDCATATSPRTMGDVAVACSTRGDARSPPLAGATSSSPLFAAPSERGGGQIWATVVAQRRRATSVAQAPSPATDGEESNF